MNKRDELIQSYKTGCLLDAVHANLSAERNDSSILSLELVALHNERLIDVVEAFESLKNNSTSNPNFFLTRHVFEKALPNLNAPILSVMRCVLHLYREAGEDLAAGTIIDGFIAFCEKDPSRPHEALMAIEASPGEFANLLTATLSTGARIDHPLYLSETLRLCEDKNIELRRRAISSLGQLNWPAGIGLPDSVFDTLEGSSERETDDQILANIIRTTFALSQRATDQESRAIALITSVLAKGDEYALHAASELFGFHTDKLTTSFLDVLFKQLLRVKTTNKGTLDNIDYGISNLLKKDNPDKVIRFLEDLLLAHPQKLTMDAFDSSIRAVLNNKALISKVLTRWFMRGDRILCEGVHTIIRTHYGKALPLEIDPSELKPSDLVHILFVARKTIGYLFIQPISAASILISLMRQTTDDKVLAELSKLLFDPLLLNFTGKVRDYLIQQSDIESGKLKAAIGNALKAIDDYLKDLRSVGNLAALHPGETQREAYHRHFSRLMTESYKEAEAKSVFLNLVSKSVLLYGRKSINYVYDLDRKPNRMETELQSFGTEIEIPRMENIDPFGLDYMLRIFRNEQFRI
ncbi:MAG: hypothetical protein EPN22_06835 [Nitrospirae bacterium]|nr:MAG: hypothetical protein EPN22_06835 [Nitrospirota bacterium]